MKTVKTRNELDTLRQSFDAHKSIGFVPTMGALHQGHLSLVQHSKRNNDYTIVSIFVNPSQFNNPADLEKYPRMPEEDLQLLEKEGVDIVFLPEASEMYPEPDSRVFGFSPLDQVMEGRFRPGHFNGVGQIVSKLFNFVQPQRAYFGQKDFQQLAIIRKMVSDYKYPVEIISVPTVREPDGLALSSRNLRLSAEHRAVSPLIYKTLTESKKLIHKKNVKETEKFVIQTINQEDLLQVEYFEIVNAHSLEKVSRWTDSPNPVGCIAVYAGEIRLIDNIIYSED